MHGLIELDRPIAFHRVFFTITGSINAALFLSQANYWAVRTNDQDGWFYKTIDEWTEETGMSRREIDTARKILKTLGILQERLSGQPARLFYRLNGTQIRLHLDDIHQTSVAKLAKLEREKQPNKNEQNRQTNTETTTETTTENTPLPPLKGGIISPPQKLPDWLDAEVWDSFVKFRKEIKAPLSVHAAELALRKLERLRKEGQDPTQVIEQSILSGWKGLFSSDDRRAPSVEQWWRSNAGIDAKGREIGLNARGGENYENYKTRIFEELKVRT